MRKIISTLCVLSLMIVMFASCGDDTDSSSSSQSSSVASSSSESTVSEVSGVVAEYKQYLSTLPKDKLSSVTDADTKAMSLMGEDKEQNDAIVLELVLFIEVVTPELNKSAEYTSEKLQDPAVAQTVNSAGLAVKDDGTKYWINYAKTDTYFKYMDYMSESGIAYMNQLRAYPGVEIGTTAETTSVDWKAYSNHIAAWETYLVKYPDKPMAAQAEVDMANEMHFMFVNAEKYEFEEALAEYKTYETAHTGSEVGKIMTKLYAEYEKNELKPLPDIEATLNTIGFYDVYPFF